MTVVDVFYALTADRGGRHRYEGLDDGSTRLPADAGHRDGLAAAGDEQGGARSATVPSPRAGLPLRDLLRVLHLLCHEATLPSLPVVSAAPTHPVAAMQSPGMPVSTNVVGKVHPDL